MPIEEVRGGIAMQRNERNAQFIPQQHRLFLQDDTEVHAHARPGKYKLDFAEIECLEARQKSGKIHKIQFDELNIEFPKVVAK